uniref:Uncharacterized protein n=1 Tax=Rhizophora mucronata TaxID=61149 RepID=A0A2P2M601_RHIMU
MPNQHDSVRSWLEQSKANDKKASKLAKFRTLVRKPTIQIRCKHQIKLISRIIKEIRKTTKP